MDRCVQSSGRDGGGLFQIPRGLDQGHRQGVGGDLGRRRPDRFRTPAAYRRGCGAKPRLARFRRTAWRDSLGPWSSNEPRRRPCAGLSPSSRSARRWACGSASRTRSVATRPPGTAARPIRRCRGSSRVTRPSATPPPTIPQLRRGRRLRALPLMPTELRRSAHRPPSLPVRTLLPLVARTLPAQLS